ncbi:hypothetical protein NKG94_29050 [Micromonospora sp. M12]
MRVDSSPAGATPIIPAERKAQVTSVMADIARCVCDDTHRRDESGIAVPAAAAQPSAATKLVPPSHSASRAAMILGSVTLSILLLCCTGTAIVSALKGDPEPSRTGTAAEQPQQPILAAPAETDEVPAQAESPVGAPSTALSTAPTTAAPSPAGAAPAPVVRVTTVTERATIRYGERSVRTRPWPRASGSSGPRA